MSSDYDDIEEVNFFLGRSFLFWAILIGLVIISGTFVHYWLQPTWLGYEHKAFVSSHQYIEARKTEVLENMAKYDELTVEIAKYEQADGDNSKIIAGLKMQQRSLAKKIKAALAKIPQEEWPDGSERF